MIGPRASSCSQPDDERTHIFISSGTGNAPFVSMMRQLLLDGAPRQVVFLNGVSYAHELGYRERAGGLGAHRRVPGDLHPDGVAAQRPVERRLDGRTGRVEAILGAGARRAAA